MSDHPPKKRKDPPNNDDDGEPPSVKFKAEKDGGEESDESKEEEQQEEKDMVLMELFGYENEDDESDEEDGDNSNEEEEEENDNSNRLIREYETKLQLNGGIYTFHFQMLKFPGLEEEGVKEINVKLYYDEEEAKAKGKAKKTTSSKEEDAEEETTKNDEEVGYLTAFLLPRPPFTSVTAVGDDGPTTSSSFHEMADGVSDELAELATMFCNRQGHLTRIDTGLKGKDITTGGFLQIYSLEVRGPEHAGQCDIGLHLVHETLLFVGEEWNIAVMVPLLLGVHIQRWPSFHNRLQINPHALEHTVAQNEGLKVAHLKIKRHFARMGFCQAGRNSEHHHAWYVTAPAYFGGAGQQQQQLNRDSEQAKKQWKSKEQIQSLDIFIAPDKHQPEGVDAELYTLVMEESIDVNKISELVKQRKASIHNSRALFVAAASNDTALLRVLTKDLEGGNVNEADENGNTPLHVAALMMCYDAIEYLVVKHGAADKGATNDKGHTPLQTAEDALRAIEEDSMDGNDEDVHDEEDIDQKEMQQKCLQLLQLS